MDRVKEHLQCPICLETFSSPRSLNNCLHTFCEECLFETFASFEKTNIRCTDFPCPICRKTVARPPSLSRVTMDWVKTFPINHVVNSLLQIAVEDDSGSHSGAAKCTISSTASTSHSILPSQNQSSISTLTWPDSCTMSTGATMGNAQSMLNPNVNTGGIDMFSASVGRTQSIGSPQINPGGLGASSIAGSLDQGHRFGLVNQSGHLVSLGLDPTQFSNSLANRNIIWRGQLEWRDNQAVAPGQNSHIIRNLSCMVSNYVTDPEMNTTNWPRTLIMQLMPQSLLYRPLLQPLLRSSRHMMLHFNSNPETLGRLHMVLDNGFAGVVHFPHACNIRVLVLLYSKSKSFVGLIPNDQNGVVNGIKQVIIQHKQMMTQSKALATAREAGTRGTTKN